MPLPKTTGFSSKVLMSGGFGIGAAQAGQQQAHKTSDRLLSGIDRMSQIRMAEQAQQRTSESQMQQRGAEFAMKQMGDEIGALNNDWRDLTETHEVAPNLASEWASAQRSLAEIGGGQIRMQDIPAYAAPLVSRLNALRSQAFNSPRRKTLRDQVESWQNPDGSWSHAYPKDMGYRETPPPKEANATFRFSPPAQDPGTDAQLAEFDYARYLSEKPDDVVRDEKQKIFNNMMKEYSASVVKGKDGVLRTVDGKPAPMPPSMQMASEEHKRLWLVDRAKEVHPKVYEIVEPYGSVPPTGTEQAQGGTPAMAPAVAAGQAPAPSPVERVKIALRAAENLLPPDKRSEYDKMAAEYLSKIKEAIKNGDFVLHSKLKAEFKAKANAVLGIGSI